MSDILCRWLNVELRLSKTVDPRSISKDFANGYLIGEVLHKYQLQGDFDLFLKSNTANSKLNNFTLMEPTLQLLGVSLDLSMAQAVMREQHGAATRLLYQLFILLQKKRKAGLTGTAMEAMQPAATAFLHRVENDIYSERLRTVVKREADLKLQKIALKYEIKGREIYDKSVMAHFVEEQRRQKVQEEMRLQDIEKHRHARRKQHEMMTRIQTAVIQIPKPPPNRTLKALEKQQQNRKKQEAQKVHMEIAQFEKNRKKLSPAGGFGTSSLSAQHMSAFHSEAPRSHGSQLQRPEELAQANSEYIQKIRQRLEEDATARQQREKRRRHVLVEQLKAHEAQEEALREEQLVERLTRQSQLERRLAVQLMQLRQQKDVLRQNRVFRERQYQEQRLRDFQEALEREAALARQASLDHAEDTRKEIEVHDRIATERAQARYRKHSDSCREILEQIVDLATKAGEYRLLTGNLIPGKLMREWKELMFCGKPLYDSGSLEELPADPTPEQFIEVEKQEILNNQDYDEYMSMTGEWTWPEEGETKPPPSNNNILGHVVLRLQTIVNPPKPDTLPPFFPRFTLKACVLGKLFSGKTTCLTRIAKVHHIHILSANVLIQEALAAHQLGKLGRESPESCETLATKDIDQVEMDTQMEEESSQGSGPLAQEPQQQGAKKKPKLSVRAQHGAAVEKFLRKGRSVPDELLVDIAVEAIRAIPADSGWILDGFPVDLTQAKLLEKALGGSDTGKERKRRNKRSNLSVDSNAPKEPPPPSPVLDLALLLDVSDDHVLDRAAKQAYEEESSDLVGAGEESCAPAREHNVVIARDKSLEKRQIQHRITAFQDTWPKLEKWFSGKQSILMRLNAEMSEDMLFRKVESILYQAMMQSEKGEGVVLDSGKAPAVSTALVQVTPVAVPAPTESTSTLTQEGLTPPVKCSSSKSNSRSPKGSQSNIEKNTSEGKDVHLKLSKSGSGGAVGHSRTLSIASSFENSHGVTTSPTEPLAPTPGTTHWVYVDEPLPKEIPEYLVPYWENVCNSYVTNVKAVMQNLRTERILIIHHLFNIREEFKQYLRRPDLKQEFVSQWQQNYNSIPKDMRDDEETKAELHQRLDDLRERLWDICDKRKEEAGQERAAIMCDGWLEDHTAVLINHFSTLIQVEVDRFQDSLRLLRDYYTGMYKQVLSEAAPEFTCIPLLDIVALEEPGNQTDKSKSSERVTKSAGKRDCEGDEKKKTKVVPLIPRRPPSTEVASMKQKGFQDPDEKLLHDIYQTALTAINNMVSVEAAQREAEENEEAQQQMDRERLQRMSQASASAAAAAANSGKDKKKAGTKKKGPPSPAQEPSPPPAPEEDSEEVCKRAIRNKIRQEYAAALDHEDSAVKVRVELVKACALCMVRVLHRQAEQAFRTMEEWLGARFLSEMNSIDQLAEVVRHHIESAAKLQSELMLVCTDFFLNGDVRVVVSPPNPPRPAPLELPTDSTLTILQLEAFYRQLRKVAPTGVQCSTDFWEILQEITSLNMGTNALPDPWMHISESQLVELVSMLTQNTEMLDWRQFLLSAALPWPTPTLPQLLQVLARFKMEDTGATGSLTEEQYLKVELWFPSERALPIPEDLSEPLPYDRLANLRKFFFLLFADPDCSPARVDYVTMLLYFAAHPDPTQGFVRALSVVMGQPLRHQSSSRLLKSVPYMEEGLSESTELEEEVEPQGGPRGEEGVSIPALLRAICHGGAWGACQNRFHPNWKTPDEYKEDFVKVYRELGYKVEDKIPFSILSQHPVIQDLIEGSAQYQLIDIHRALQVQQSEGEPLMVS
ncbi:sperm flagellar protein 2 isoform X1 [Oncorhynchus tshawytscha]|uniref:Calponin-homology (CH) domain-containing protein n=1 Tax=Oncorhynchus tshawytscha TaxID=74940 RepID=A0AAZ3SPJ7_ONCTS|nr:sperm flagellar protein 2 isoform X1 [Oncorhynchus tshawytscha]